MHREDHLTAEELIRGIDTSHARISAAQRELFRQILEADRRALWRDSGAQDLAHWLSMRQGISGWKASRWIASAHALEHLPGISEAFASGALGIDKVVELTRFATPETETGLVSWAMRVSGACIRRKADLAVREPIEVVKDADRARSLSWWYLGDGRRFGLEAELPAAEGAVVAKALERLADDLPVMPEEEDTVHLDARRADALVALCSSRIAKDADADRATVIVHASLSGLMAGEGSFELEGGGVIDASTARRLSCNARIQAVIEDEATNPVRIGRMLREPPAWMLRQLRYRDRECTFPGCGTRRFTQAHHIVWWGLGGPTDLPNLALVCSFHHKLVHEHGWSLKRDQEGTLTWLRPDGSSHLAGPGPPLETVERQPALSAVGY
ncbi:MAG TPA: DUF222 domain-containing protein [Actinomycetota bacterium]|nr:DUF222 domain-containing protein [Actinomycetota bacterium]